MTTDLDYYRARALEERNRAAAASDPSIANIHLELAAKYEARAKDARAGPTLRPGWGGTSDGQVA
jgi:hypothetical protein